MIGRLGSMLRGSERDPTEANLERRVLLVLGADLVLGLLLVWLNLMIQDLGYRIGHTGRLIEKLDLEYAELQSELWRETTPEKLRRQASETLSLGIPMPGQVLTVDAQP
jgi:hypothetical protein